jgi:two-component system response regulator VicR
LDTILVVEDEVAISKVLQAYLQKAGYSVEPVYDGRSALEQFESRKPSLVLLDVMLPDTDGWQILSHIRKTSLCPVIMLTALGDIDYKLAGLNRGADDYITKPFVGAEVVARVQAVLRRTTQVMEHDGVKFFGDLKVNFKSRSVSLYGAPLDLAPRDLTLFLFLARHPNQIFTRDQLIERVWGIDYDGSDRAVDLAVKRLRKAFENWPESHGEIKTSRGLGYQFCVYTK